MAVTLVCAKCGASQEVVPPVGRRSECVGCGTDLRVCLHCDFYEPAASRACRETMAEPPRDKDRANFCEYFRVRTQRGVDAGAQKENLRAAAEALFKKKP